MWCNMYAPVKQSKFFLIGEECAQITLECEEKRERSKEGCQRAEEIEKKKQPAELIRKKERRGY